MKPFQIEILDNKAIYTPGTEDELTSVERLDKNFSSLCVAKMLTECRVLTEKNTKI